METSEEISELVSALAIAQGSIQGAKKDVNNPFFKSKYADLQSVWSVARKPLSDNGLAVVQTPENSENGVTLRTALFHSSGQWIASTLDLPVKKDDPQGYGSAISYARRYSLAAMIGVYSEDDDGNAAKKGTKEPGYMAAPKAIEHIRGIKKLGLLKEACGKYQDDYQSGATGWTKPAWNTLCAAMTDVKDKLESEAPAKNRSNESESDAMKNALKPPSDAQETGKQEDKQLGKWAKKLVKLTKDPLYQTAIQKVLQEKKATPESIGSEDEEAASVVCLLIEKQMEIEENPIDWPAKLYKICSDDAYSKIINDLVVSNEISGPELKTMHGGTAKRLCELLEETKGFADVEAKENLETQPVDENSEFF